MDNLPEVGLSAVIENLKQFTDAANQITKSYDEMNASGNSVEESSSMMSGALGGVSSILSGVLVAASAAALAAVVALAAGFVGLSMTALDVAQDMDDASDAIIIGTGASGEALEEMEGIVLSLSESSAGVGTSYEMMGKTVAEINTRLGLTGEELENAASSALNFARVTGGDAVKSTQLATRVMGDWGIESENLGGTLDTLFGASQAFGISTDALAQKVVQFGAPLRQMGFTLEESVALFGKWEKEGVNAELAIGSLRIAAGKFARENVPLREGLEQTMEAIKGATSESEALALGMDVFGARAGPDMTAAIRENRFELESAIEALKGTSGGLDDAATRTLDFSENMEIMWNKVRNSLLPFGNSMREVADDIMPLLDEALLALQPALEEFAVFLGDKLQKAAQELIPWIKDNLVPALFDISNWIMNEGIPGLVNFADWIYTELIPAIKEWYTWFKDNIWPVILDVADVIKNDVIPAISDFVSWITDDLVPALKDIYEWVDDNILPVFEDLFKLFSKDGKKAGGIMSDIWEDISKRLEPFIEDILPELLKIWNEILAWTKRNWPKIQTIIIVTMLAIEKKINTILSWIEDFWEKWGETILDVTESTFGYIWRTIKRIMSLIGDVIELALNVITGDWKGAWANIKSITETVNNQIKDYIDTTLKNIKTIISNAWNLIKSDIETKLDAIKTAINTKWDEIKSNVETKLNALKTAIDTKFNSIKTSIENIWSAIKTAVVNAVGAMMQGIIDKINSFASSVSTTLSTVISNAVSSLLTSITSGTIYTTLTAIGKKVIDVITAAFSTVGNVAEKLRTAIANGVQGVIDDLGTLGEKLIGLATTVITKIITGLTNFVNKTLLITGIKAAIGGAIASLWDGATALLNSIYNVGKRIIDSIVSGIKSNYYSVKEALKKIVKDLVEDALDFLGFGSPSKIFLGMGEGLSASLALGITKGIPTIESALRGMSIAPLMSAPISSGSTASQAISNQTFNLGGNTIANSMDAATFEARVMDVIRRNV